MTSGVARIQIVTAPAASERLAAARAFVERVPPAAEVLAVGASREAADDLAREISARRGATFGLRRLGFLQLASVLAAAEMARQGRAPITALGVEALASRVAFEALAEGGVPYLGPVVRFPGFAPTLAATLAELRRAGVGADRVAAAGGPSADVAALLARFEAQLESAHVADRAALLALAAAGASSDWLPALRRMPIVLLDVPIEGDAERRFVAALIEEAPAVLVTIPAGDDATLAAAELLAGGSAKARGAPGEPAASVPGRSPVEARDLARMREYLFSPIPPPAATPTGDVVFFSAPGEGREAVEIARLVLDQARAGVAFDRMAVLLRTPGSYWSLLEAALSRAGIPAFFARRARRPDPAGRAFLALLDCAREGLSARRFAEYLSLGQVPRLDPGGGPPLGPRPWVVADDEVLGSAVLAVPPDPGTGDGEADAWPDDTAAPTPAGAGAAPAPVADADAAPVVDGTLRAPWKWEALLVESAVIGGRERWARRLAGLEAEYRVRLDALSAEEPESPRAQGLERDRRNLGHLRRFALPVIERLAELPASAAWGDWLPALETLAPMVLRRPERVLAVLAELRPLAPVGPVALDEVRDVLLARLAHLEQRPPATRYGRVFVGTVEQARGLAFDVVFLPGLAERVFPQKPREDPLLLDEVRGRLAAGLADQHERSRRERLLLRLAAGAATRRLYVSYSRLDLAVARPRVPSFYALEVHRALTGRIPDPRTLQQEASAEVDARLAWPAPRERARAIDEEEHDLATLGALLREPAADVRGRARYLLEASPALARSLRTRWARWEQPRWTPYDGIVRVADGTREVLAASSLAARAYSVSALQKFAVCPYQFFLSAICRLEPREEIAPLDRLDPATRGRMFHEVQAETLRALQRAGRLPMAGAGEPADLAVLDATFARVAARYHEELAPAIERVWQTELESMRVDLRVWLERSADIQATWEPVAFELGFGLPVDPAFDPRSVAAEAVLGGFRLRGIVDLVERRRGGGELRVTDYKTGGNWTRWRMVVGGGEVLQPVIYALAVEAVLGDRVSEGRLFFCTREGGFGERVVPVDEGARAAGRCVLEIVDRAVVRGLLPPSPRARACGICDFREVCGPWEERRVQLKDRRALADLDALRELR